MEEIFSAIPHREPFLFVDRIVDVTQNSIRTEKRFTGKEDFFRGHYPGQPILPGVLICEAVVQTGAILLAHIAPSTDAKSVPVLGRIREAKFKRPVFPGQLLEMEATLDEHMSGAYFLTGKASVGGTLCATLSFACLRTTIQQ